MILMNLKKYMRINFILFSQNYKFSQEKSLDKQKIKIKMPKSPKKKQSEV